VFGENVGLSMFATGLKIIKKVKENANTAIREAFANLFLRTPQNKNNDIASGKAKRI
jgi:hypothetical protein